MTVKWTCPQCNTEFSRRWNMQRHIGTQHSAFGSRYRGNPVINPSINSRRIPFQYKPSRHEIEPELKHVSNDEIFPGMTKMENNVRRMKEAADNMQSIMKFNPPNIADLQGRLNSVTNQLNYIMSNCMIVPKDQILGISGYFCKRCQCFSTHFVRDPGYDMTAQNKHTCEENKVKRIHAVSIRPSDLASRDNFWAKVLLTSVNKFMPERKYLKGVDITELFNELSSTHDSSMAKGLLGIPDRFSLYTYNNPDKSDWLKRAIENLGKKTPIVEHEIIDFLGKLKSSYGIFEILGSASSKMIFLYLVA